MPIYTVINLKNYKSRAENHKEILKTSTLFDEAEKERLNEIFDELIAIYNDKIVVQTVVVDFIHI
jgi:hypothetical protein